MGGPIGGLPVVGHGDTALGEAVGDGVPGLVGPVGRDEGPEQVERNYHVRVVTAIALELCGQHGPWPSPSYGRLSPVLILIVISAISIRTLIFEVAFTVRFDILIGRLRWYETLHLFDRSPLRNLIEHAAIIICIPIYSGTAWSSHPSALPTALATRCVGVYKNGRRPDSEADVPVWTPTVTRPISRGGYRTRHSLDRSGAGGRTTHRMLDRCTGVPWAPRGGKRCVLCQRLPSTTTSSNRSILPKRALIVHVILSDAVLRFVRRVRYGRSAGCVDRRTRQWRRESH